MSEEEYSEDHLDEDLSENTSFEQDHQSKKRTKYAEEDLSQARFAN
jgi:hypothetical protein